MPCVAPVPVRRCHRLVGAAAPRARGDALLAVRVAGQLMNLLQEAVRTHLWDLMLLLTLVPLVKVFRLRLST